MKLNVEFSEEYNQSMVNEMVKQLIPVLVPLMKQYQLKPLMTRREFMEFVGIGESKCAELFHRHDFPVNRELGHPRVVTKDFFEWLHATNQNRSEVNLKYPYEVV